MPSDLRPDHLQCMVCGTVWQVQMKIADCRCSMHEQVFVTYFCSHDLQINQMTIYELDPYPMEIYWICENELPMSRLTKIIV